MSSTKNVISSTLPAGKKPVWDMFREYCSSEGLPLNRTLIAAIETYRPFLVWQARMEALHGSRGVQR